MTHALLLIGGFLALGLALSVLNQFIEDKSGARASPARASRWCRWGFHKWGKPYEPMDNGHMETCTRPNCDAVREVITDPDGAV